MAGIYRRPTMVVLAAVATVSLVLAVVAAGALAEGYRQALYPVAILGASGMPRAMAFNILGFIVPGAFATWLAVRLRATLPGDAPWAARIGSRLLVIAGLAFAAQGLLPLDGSDLASPAMRLHAVAWLTWGIGFFAGTLLLAIGWRRSMGARALQWASAAASAVVLAMSLLPLPMLPAGVPPRIALAAWLAWWLLAGVAGDRMRLAALGALR